MAALRRAKQDVALTLGLADLAGAIPTGNRHRARSPASPTRRSSAALRFALADAARAGQWTRRHGSAAASSSSRMGKYGAGELNYSSDIDLIALFDPKAAGLADGVEPSAFWVRIVRLLVALLQERTADGYVFRIDLRLRPDPAATPRRALRRRRRSSTTRAWDRTGSAPP